MSTSLPNGCPLAFPPHVRAPDPRLFPDGHGRFVLWARQTLAQHIEALRQGSTQGDPRLAVAQCAIRLF